MQGSFDPINVPVGKAACVAMKGIVDYIPASSSGDDDDDAALVALRLYDQGVDSNYDYYIGYNKATSFNYQSVEDQNAVLIISQEKNKEFYAQSWKNATLKHPGDSFVIPNWGSNGGGGGGEHDDDDDGSIKNISSVVIRVVDISLQEALICISLLSSEPPSSFSTTTTTPSSTTRPSSSIISSPTMFPTTRSPTTNSLLGISNNDEDDELGPPTATPSTTRPFPISPTIMHPTTTSPTKSSLEILNDDNDELGPTVAPTRLRSMSPMTFQTASPTKSLGISNDEDDKLGPPTTAVPSSTRQPIINPPIMSFPTTTSPTKSVLGILSDEEEDEFGNPTVVPSSTLQPIISPTMSFPTTTSPTKSVLGILNDEDDEFGPPTVAPTRRPPSMSPMISKDVIYYDEFGLVAKVAPTTRPISITSPISFPTMTSFPTTLSPTTKRLTTASPTIIRSPTTPHYATPLSAAPTATTMTTWCENKDLKYKNRSTWNCEWIGNKINRRCAYVWEDESVATYWCPKQCNDSCLLNSTILPIITPKAGSSSVSATCTNKIMSYKNRKNKNCEWVKENTDERCVKEWKNKSIATYWCPFTCNDVCKERK